MGHASRLVEHLTYNFNLCFPIRHTLYFLTTVVTRRCVYATIRSCTCGSRTRKVIYTHTVL